MRIEIAGCDDTTEFELHIHPTELHLLRRIAAKSKETSSYGCMPIFKIDVINE